MDKLEDRIRAKTDDFSDTITQESHREEKMVGRENLEPSANNGGRGGNRTPDTRIFSPLLYRLSYPPIKKKPYRPREERAKVNINRYNLSMDKPG
jgi:hypothetical protein